MPQIDLKQARRDFPLAYVFSGDLYPHPLYLTLSDMNGDGKGWAPQKLYCLTSIRSSSVVIWLDKGTP